MPSWHRIAILAGVLALTAIAAWLIDHVMADRELPPQAATRYRVLRRSIVTAIVAVGLLSALLVIPQVRAVAGGILASGAVLGIIIGFASRSTLGNFVAGLLIAFTQPVRLGDRVEIAGTPGTVEEIGLTYTFVRTDDNSRLVIPNETLASDTIRNSTIVDREKLAEVTVQVPLTRDLDSIAEALRAQVSPNVEVIELTDKATIAVRERAADASEAREVEGDLRLRVHRVLREAGVFE
jgi:small conductance mechanosensitive channel